MRVLDTSFLSQIIFIKLDQGKLCYATICLLGRRLAPSRVQECVVFTSIRFIEHQTNSELLCSVVAHSVDSIVYACYTYKLNEVTILSLWGSTMYSKLLYSL